jgi:hypothetical protein
MMLAGLILLSPVIVLLVAVAIIVIFNIMIPKAHLQPVSAGGGPPVGGSGDTNFDFESADWADDWDQFLDSTETSTDETASFTRSDTWSEFGTYSLKMNSGSGYAVARVDYGKEPAKIRCYFRRHTGEHLIFCGYGATDDTADYVEGGMGAYHMSGDDLSNARFSQTGYFAPDDEDYNIGLSNGETYYMEITFDTTGGTTTVTVQCFDMDDVAQSSLLSSDYDNSQWSNDIFVGCNGGDVDSFIDLIEVYDT